MMLYFSFFTGEHCLSLILPSGEAGFADKSDPKIRTTPCSEKNTHFLLVSIDWSENFRQHRWGNGKSVC